MEHGPNFLRPPLDLINGEEEYEVEVVLGHKGKPGRHTFLIRWKGYSAAEDTWEPERNLGNAQPLIIEYKSPDQLIFLNTTTTTRLGNKKHEHVHLLPHHLIFRPSHHCVPRTRLLHLVVYFEL